MKSILTLALIFSLFLVCAGCSSDDKSTTPTTTTPTKSIQTSSPTRTTLPTTQVTTIPTIKATTPPPTTKALSGPICDCSGDKYNCDDFPLPNGASAYDCYNYCKSVGKGDVHKLDRDGDGRMCEKT